ncbi:MAG: polysaccharide biosynthesis tyrosine autokinase [Chloroflexi bacterium]|nr:MAG: polysaccharide biosynthesis tyrosine autokinase [Chloroflexota bacterium]
MERSFDLIQLLKLVRRWAPVVAFMTLLAGGLAFVVARAAVPSYQSCGLLRVAVQAPSGSQAASASDITQTDAVLMTQNGVLSEVIRDLHLRISSDQLRAHLVARPGPSSELITVCSSGASGTQQAAIVNAVMSVYAAQATAQSERDIDQAGAALQSEIQKVEASLLQENQQLAALQRGHQDTMALAGQIQADTATLTQLSANYSAFRAQQGVDVAHVSVAAAAVAPAAPISRNLYTDAGIGAVAGLLIGTAIAVVLQLLDQGLRTEEDVRQKVGVPVLGVIPSYSRDPKSGTQMRTAVADEAYRSLRTSLLFAGVDRTLRSVVVTSARVGEGKTRTAANLSAVLGAAGSRVLLLDADMRRPGQHRLFNHSAEPGLSELLLTVATTGQPPNLSGAQKTRFTNLSLMTAGMTPPNPSELLASRAAELTLRWLEHSYDIVVIDTPPVDAVTDALPLAAEASATVVVIEAGATGARQLQRALEVLKGSGANVIGVVLNKSRRDPPREYLDYYFSQAAASQPDSANAEKPARRPAVQSPVASAR